ncbi:uncharacterized protein F5147DRAFT_813081 [Suillus discolor]|uniref:Uncharacterized protein n=1 Tax=Suillus discolor TaxID=1912936 RepID=A0A9P7JQL1_9AGAM|nr:uncharacterized protein F5147DRAFT_813081 [Suillus discolor]KAG2100433.1 hypothetical protein F5147DRAFT_813081 [Suillus discolor]
MIDSSIERVFEERTNSKAINSFIRDRGRKTILSGALYIIVLLHDTQNILEEHSIPLAFVENLPPSTEVLECAVCWYPTPKKALDLPLHITQNTVNTQAKVWKPREYKRMQGHCTVRKVVTKPGGSWSGFHWAIMHLTISAIAAMTSSSNQYLANSVGYCTWASSVKNKGKKSSEVASLTEANSFEREAHEF